MAGADYYLCDWCSKKTFYDAHCYHGKIQNRNPETGHPWPDGDVGDMAVLCNECAQKKVRIVIQEKTQE